MRGRHAGLMLSLVAGAAGLLGSTRFARPVRAVRPLIRAVTEAPVPELQATQRRTRDKLHIRIDDEWYDLTNWRMAHPAGAHWIDAYNGKDATEVMYGFHSDKGMGLVKRLPKSKDPPKAEPPPVASSYAFREFRQKLEADGWFKPHWRGELQKLLPWAACLAIAKRLSVHANPLAALGAVFFYATSNTLSGWLAHDYVHGRNPFSMAMRGFRELVGGMSTTWWSMKHNMHHALTNEIGYDEDVALEPALYLWQPDPKNDSPVRKFQHLYWPIPFSVLFLYWRLDSVRDALCSNWFSDILWGGMQWQLEHHLFPIMPRYKYKALHPILREWAKKHKMDFRTSGEWEILVQNVNQLKKQGHLPAVEGNPDSTPIFKQ